MLDKKDLIEIYSKAKADRQKYVDAILNSKSTKNIVVAGPGTGKTYLFKEILAKKSNSLTLTFVNNLVEDLSLELCGLSEVKTLHGFARSILTKAIKGEIKIFPKLSSVIKEDAKILLGEKVNFDYLFHNRDDKSKNIEFYMRRKKYYGAYYGYADVIFALVKRFESNIETVPIYDQVVVDEFQDFNLLEVSLIELLSRKSPILLAGDDDQALYDFKSASTKYIREKFSEVNTDFVSFTLPYCSRCTEAIVGAANDIIKKSTVDGYLVNRINKEYLYFHDENKDKDSSQYNKITYAQLFSTQIPWFIEQQIGKIAAQTRNKFSVLIISPTKVQSRQIVTTLANKGLENIEPVNKKDDIEVSFIDGLKILLIDDKSNLGWRIVAKFLLQSKDFETLLQETSKTDAKNIVEFIGKDNRREIDEILKLLRSIKNNKTIDKEKLDDILHRIGVDYEEMATEYLKYEISSSLRRVGNPAIRKIPIKATTIQGSKGLSADYVFITHFDDQYFIKDKDKSKILDQDIYNFLVSLTRAKKKVYLISSRKDRVPVFLTWIDKNHIERQS